MMLRENAAVPVASGASAVGHYVTEDVSAAYLQSLESSIRTQDRTQPGRKIVTLA